MKRKLTGPTLMTKNRNGLPRPKAEKPEPEKVEPTIERIPEKPPLDPLAIKWITDLDGFAVPTRGWPPEDDGPGRWPNDVTPLYKR